MLYRLLACLVQCNLHSVHSPCHDMFNGMYNQALVVVIGILKPGQASRAASGGRGAQSEEYADGVFLFWLPDQTEQQGGEQGWHVLECDPCYRNV